jgi:hypothetical protein
MGGFSRNGGFNDARFFGYGSVNSRTALTAMNPARIIIRSSQFAEPYATGQS